MNRALKDENGVNSLIAVSSADGTTIDAVTADPSTHAISVSDGTSGTDFGPTNALRDVNNVSTVMAVSSADGVTPVPLYTDGSGKTLIQTT